MKKIIKLEDIGLYSRLPDDLNELLNGEQMKYLQNQVSKKPVRLIMYKGKIVLQIGPKRLFNLSVSVDNKTRKFVLVLDDDIK